MKLTKDSIWLILIILWALITITGMLIHQHQDKINKQRQEEIRQRMSK